MWTRMISDGYESEGSLSDSDKFDDNDGRVSTSQTSTKELLSFQPGNHGDDGYSNDIIASYNEVFDQKKGMSRNKSLSSEPESGQVISSIQAIPSQGNAVYEFKGVTTDLFEMDVENVSPVAANFEQVGAVLNHTSRSTEQIRALAPRQREDLDSICSINIGMDDIIYRWKLGSVIKYNVNRSSFPEVEQATYATKCLEKAAGKWNDGDVGVRFERVSDDAKAVFQLVYEPIDKDHGGRLAHSFLAWSQYTLERLLVYKLAFGHPHYSMVNVFCHELGHILGLRHEFSLEREMACSSVQWGSRNSLSIMTYHKSSSLQETDITELKQFYEFSGKEYKGFGIIDLDPMYF
ncbi:uncharacterized protein GGS22DRAFT_166145 [Annulohypoxylon maeteangense]|uniref:uncharacterized protein n=1 Tax=Annulohypoxylon maeteangense TaxID=1927788 RepID=UPI0020087482|nr:uncharacterized protein GGS22DRAFT_166145 [Annulohypoxylon maeteangense]KAI0883812.1 hypothetical protein GGS22DRAFT_166145 [Annulohypoxylon maeteangense]